MSFKGYKREEKFIRTPYVHTLINDTNKLVFNPTYLIGPYPDAEKQIIVKQSNRSPKPFTNIHYKQVFTLTI